MQRFIKIDFEENKPTGGVPGAFVYLSPGIIGSFEFANMIRDFNKISAGQHSIKLSMDLRIANANEMETATQGDFSTSLINIAEQMADQIEADLPKTPIKVFLVGYSLGCTFTTLAAQILKKKNLNAEINLFHIDGPSPECSQAYFAKNMMSSTKDLIAIVNYAARLSGHATTLQLTDEEIQILLPLSVTKRIDKLAELLLTRFQLHGETTNEKIDKFNKLISVAKDSIENLLNHIPTNFEKLDNITALVTHETARKYGDKHIGWDQYAKKVTMITNPSLLDQEHTALLDESNSAILANLLNTRISQKIYGSISKSAAANKSESTNQEVTKLLTETNDLLSKVATEAQQGKVPSFILEYVYSVLQQFNQIKEEQSEDSENSFSEEESLSGSENNLPDGDKSTTVKNFPSSHYKEDSDGEEPPGSDEENGKKEANSRSPSFEQQVKRRRSLSKEGPISGFAESKDSFFNSQTGNNLDTSFPTSSTKEFFSYSPNFQATQDEKNALYGSQSPAQNLWNVDLSTQGKFTQFGNSGKSSPRSARVVNTSELGQTSGLRN